MGPSPMPKLKNLVLRVKKIMVLKGLKLWDMIQKENLTHVNGIYLRLMEHSLRQWMYGHFGIP
jgi:hypothetical protein